MPDRNNLGSAPRQIEEELPPGRTSVRLNTAVRRHYEHQTGVTVKPGRDRKAEVKRVTGCNSRIARTRRPLKLDYLVQPRVVKEGIDGVVQASQLFHVMFTTQSLELFMLRQLVSNRVPGGFGACENMRGWPDCRLIDQRSH